MLLINRNMHIMLGFNLVLNVNQYFTVRVKKFCLREKTVLNFLVIQVFQMLNTVNISIKYLSVYDMIVVITYITEHSGILV